MRFLLLTALGLAGLAASPRSVAVTLSVTPEVTGRGPETLGFNIAHFMPGSNAADWWRYSGVNAARVFLSPGIIEPEDDLPPHGDGVTSLAEFMERRKALRAAPTTTATSPTGTLPHLRLPFVNWPALEKGFESSLSSGNNHYLVNDTFTRLRGLGADILVQLTAGKGPFPITGPEDWTGLWELWQHYYFQAYHLGSKFDVERYSMFNEPNHKAAGGISTADWLLRLRFASDAIQAAIGDVNRDFKKHLIARIHAPTTAGAIDSAFENWGKPAIQDIHHRIDGTSDPEWENFHVYSYQYYGMNPTKLGSQALTLQRDVGSLMPKLPPFAITEFNVRTGADFDKISDTLDSPCYASALTADCIALTEAGIANLYLFKFGMTATGASYSDYPVQKNGIHHVDNRTGAGTNNYGGITLAGEAWRLFNRMAGGEKDRLKVVSATAKETLTFMATRDRTDGTTWLIVANRDDNEVPVEINADALGVPDGCEIEISEVSNRCYGTVRHLSQTHAGVISPPDSVMPGQSVWLVRIPDLSRAGDLATFELKANATTELRDGRHRKSPATPGNVLRVSNGTADPDGRRVAVIGFDLASLDPAAIESATLSLAVRSSTDGTAAQAHAYALTDSRWQEDSLCWADFPPLLQKVPAGPLIRNNVILGDARDILIQGQLHVEGTDPEIVQIDVTGYLKARARGRATFLIVQESRWDTSLDGRKSADITIGDGDRQPAGIIIGARNSASPPVLRIVRRASVSASDVSPPVATGG